MKRPRQTCLVDGLCNNGMLPLLRQHSDDAYYSLQRRVVRRPQTCRMFYVWRGARTSCLGLCQHGLYIIRRGRWNCCHLVIDLSPSTTSVALSSSTHRISLAGKATTIMSTYTTMSNFSPLGEPFPRPSHPTPTTALSPPIPLPIHATWQPQRPKLRIITDPEQIPAGVRRPVPIRHPALVKTAPILAHPIAETYPPIYKVQAWQAQVYHNNLIPSIPTMTLSTSSPSPPAPPPPKAPASEAKKKGHSRKLSDKFKNLFSALHIKKDDRIPIILQNDEILTDEIYDENTGRRDVPTRPHRSPGTASFLVTRHLAPKSSIPSSAHSSSTAFSMASKPSFAEKRRLYLAPYGMEESHFSNPTTLDSATGSSGRSISSGVVLEKSPGELQDRMGIEDGVRIGAKLRRVRSMPDVRVLREWQQ